MPYLMNVPESQIKERAGDAVLVSITDPGREATIPEEYTHVLRLAFDDVDPGPRRFAELGKSIVMSPKKMPEDSVLFSAEQASRVESFARWHRGRNIVVHCHAGVSRSGSIVEALLAAFPEYEDRGYRRWLNGHVLHLMLIALGLITED